MTAISKLKTTDKTIAINALLISIFAAFNPLLSYTANPIGEWFLSIISAFLFGGVVSWIYAKLRRRPAVLAVRSGGLMLAWFFMVSTVLLPYMDKAPKQSPVPQAQPYEHKASSKPSVRYYTDEEVGFPAAR